MIKLSEKSLILLEGCLNECNPKLIPVVRDDSIDSYADEFYNDLRQCVGSVLVQKGFNKDYSVNVYGQQLEDLIDEIGRLFM
ncbi:MAG: hypothetical protein RR565_06545 [Erysipelothrix sp.]